MYLFRGGGNRPLLNVCGRRGETGIQKKRAFFTKPLFCNTCGRLPDFKGDAE